MYARRSHQRLAVATISAICVLGLAACGSSGASNGKSGSSGSGSGDSGNSSKSKHYKFALITKSNATPYWLAVKDGAKAAAKKEGNIDVSFQAPSKGTDLQKQISMVNNAVTRHVDGIILAAQQPSALTGPVQKAQQQGVPVVTVDSGVKKGASKSFLATSNVGAAEHLAKYSAKLAGNKGEYGIIDFNQVASTGRERPKGFKKGMKKISGFSYVGMQVSKNNVGKGKQQTEAMLQSHPKINLMFGANDRAALGVAEGVKAAGKSKQVTVAGFDADAGELPLIKKKVIDAAVLQSPRSMGKQAVEEMVKIKHGKSVPKHVNTPYFIVTPKNIKTKKAQSFIKQYVNK